MRAVRSGKSIGDVSRLLIGYANFDLLLTVQVRGGGSELVRLRATCRMYAEDQHDERSAFARNLEISIARQTVELTDR